jgi:2'-5' RNA ligase
MSRGDSARLFVAVDLPLEVRGQLASWGRLLATSALTGRPAGPRPPMRALAEDSLHLTLCFLGSRPVAEIAPLSACLGENITPVGELSIGAPLLLPPRRPRALAVEIHDPEGELARLQRTTLAAVRRASGWAGGEGRGFRAHVTVARMPADTRQMAPDQPLPPTPQLHFSPTSVSLYRSRLAPEGASYEALASCPLTVREAE